MSNLNPRDRELVALGAAMGSNCVPCVEYHVPESRRAGLTDEEIRTAIHHADKIRQVPARKTLEAALSKLQSAQGDAGNAGTGPGGGGGADRHAGDAGGGATGRPAKRAERPVDAMVGMMSRAMASRCGQAPSSETPKTSGEKAPDSAAGEGCGCGSHGD